MGYRVDYPPKKRPRKGAGLAVCTAAWMLVFFLLVGLYWPEGARQLKNMLTPGDPARTTAALEQFAGELRQGGQLGQSLERLIARVKDGA